MNPVQVCNIALNEIGNRDTVSSINPSDGSTAANIASLFYAPKMQALLRAAPWNFCRKQIVLTQLKATLINGAVSANPPPQPFFFEYAYPPDCLRMRFIMPFIQLAPAGTPLTTAPNYWLPTLAPTTRIPFVESTDVDANGNPIKVILTNLNQAQGVYTADYSQLPDLWDDLFLTAATATLGAYFLNALARDRDQMNQQISIAKNALDSARAMNASESIPSADLQVDWIQVRMQGSLGHGAGMGPNGPNLPLYDPMALPGGLRY